MEDLDDLFTDQLNDQLNEHLGEQLNDQLNAHLETAAAAAPPPGLAERLDELRLSGCTQYAGRKRYGIEQSLTKTERSHGLAWAPSLTSRPTAETSRYPAFNSKGERVSGE